MRFYSADECRSWASGLNISFDADGRLSRPCDDPHWVRGAIPPEYARLTWFCHHIERSLQPRKQCLMWVTGWGIWDENLHLYYTLRQSYGDVRLIGEAPGHLFLEYERAELVTFLQVAVLSGWDVHLLPVAGHGRAFLSHDEFVEFASDNGDIREEFARLVTVTARSESSEP